MKNGAKKKRTYSPVNVPRHLQAARDDLIKAFYEDEELEKFIAEVSGHQLTIQEVHAWLIAAIEHYEKHGPRAEAKRVLESVIQSQRINWQ